MDVNRLKSHVKSTGIRVYSTSIPQPNLIKEQNSGVRGFVYRNQSKIGTHGSKPDSDWTIQPTQSIVKDIVEHIESNNSSDCDDCADESYPVEGFPPVMKNWETKVRRSTTNFEASSDSVSRKTEKLEDNKIDHDGNLSGEINANHSAPDDQESSRYGQDYKIRENGIKHPCTIDDDYDKVSFRHPDGEVVYRSESVRQCTQEKVIPSVICRHKTGEVSEDTVVYATGSSSYSIKKLVTLSRSAVPQMRSLALGLMCTIVNKSRCEEYPQEICSLVGKLFRENSAIVSARLALDDSYISVNDRGLDLLLLLTSTREEVIWDSIYSLSRVGSSGSNILSLSPQSLQRFSSFYGHSWFRNNANENDIFGGGDLDSQDLTIGEIVALMRKDIISGLLASDICNRLHYIISTEEENFFIVAKAYNLLARIARHSSKALDSIYNVPNILDTIKNSYLMINFSIAKHTEKLPSVLNALKLLKIMSSGSRKVSKDILDKGIIETLMRFIIAGSFDVVLDDSEVSLTEIQNEIWLLFGSVLRYEMGFFLIEQYIELVTNYVRRLFQATSLTSQNLGDEENVPFLRTLLIIIELCIKNNSPLAQSLTSDLIDALCVHEGAIQGPVGTMICDIISLCLRKSHCRLSSLHPQEHRDCDKLFNRVTLLFERFISSDQLLLLLENVTKSIEGCKELICNTPPHFSVQTSFTKYGIVSLKKEETVEKLLRTSLMCEEWAARCDLCLSIGILAAQLYTQDVKCKINRLIDTWMFGKDSLKLVSTITRSTEIPCRLLRSGDWIVWFSYGLGESLLSWLKVCKFLQAPEFTQVFKGCPEGVVSIVSYKILQLLLPGREADAENMFNIIFGKLSVSTFVTTFLKIETLGETSIISSKLTSAYVSDSCNGFYFEPTYHTQNSGKDDYEGLPLKGCWPLSLIPRLHKSTTQNSKSSSSAKSISTGDTKEILQCILNFHELLCVLHSVPVMEDLLFKYPDASLNVTIEKLIFAYHALLIPGEHFKTPEISSSLAKVLTTAASALQKHEIRISDILDTNGSFYRLYCGAVDNFKSNSFGDSLYAKYLLFMLRCDMPEDYLSYFLGELEDVLFLFESFKGGPISSFHENDSNENIYNILKYEDKVWFPRININVDILTSWFRLIVSRSLNNRSFLRAMGISYVSNSLFGRGTTAGKTIDGEKPILSDGPADNITTVKKQIARFILSNEETCPHNITCDEIFSWKDWPSYYYERKQITDVCAERRQILGSLILK